MTILCFRRPPKRGASISDRMAGASVRGRRVKFLRSAGRVEETRSWLTRNTPFASQLYHFALICVKYNLGTRRTISARRFRLRTLRGADPVAGRLRRLADVNRPAYRSIPPGLDPVPETVGLKDVMGFAIKGPGASPFWLLFFRECILGLFSNLAQGLLYPQPFRFILTPGADVQRQTGVERDAGFQALRH